MTMLTKRINSQYVEQVFTTPSYGSFWFGYYNYDPLNRNHQYLLAHKVESDGVPVRNGAVVETGYFDIIKCKWVKIGESDSWNWQQATSLQWIPNQENESRVIYNCSRRGRLISVLTDIYDRDDIIVNWPIYGLTPDGKKSIAIDMERAYWCRTYHYQSVKNESLNVPIPKEDGIYEIDLVNNVCRRIISIWDVISIDPDPDFRDLKHWFEHIMINPSGTKFAFLHRFSPINSSMQYQTRLCIADIDGGNLQIVSGWRNYSLSHFGWRTDTAFCIYCVKIPAIQKQFISSIKSDKSMRQGCFKARFIIALKDTIPPSVRRFLKGGASSNFYQFYECINGKFCPSFSLNRAPFNIDGHPSFTNDGKYMITDTYADRKGWRHLYVFSTETKKEVELARYFEPLAGNPARCDLHPKLSRDNEYIVVDTTNTGKHGMEVLRLKWDVIKKTLK